MKSFPNKEDGLCAGDLPQMGVHSDLLWVCNCLDELKNEGKISEQQSNVLGLGMLRINNLHLYTEEFLERNPFLKSDPFDFHGNLKSEIKRLRIQEDEK